MMFPPQDLNIVTAAGTTTAGASMAVSGGVTPPAPVAAPAPPDLGLLDDGGLMAVHEEGENGRPEEEERVHDPEGEGSLQQGAGLVDVHAEVIPIFAADVPEGPQGEVEGPGAEIGAVGRCDVAELVDAGDEGADEAEVDEGDEDGGAFCC